jgi:hypothetical protein
MSVAADITREQAQERVNRITAFQAELEELERSGAIRLTDEQRAQLRESAYDSSWHNRSHLVTIDIGADATALRRTYPDASRYLITAARIAARVDTYRDPPQISTLAGFIMEVMPSTINVPLPFSTIVRKAAESHSTDPSSSWTPHYSVTLRYGRFQEPWIVDVKAQ